LFRLNNHSGTIKRILLFLPPRKRSLEQRIVDSIVLFGRVKRHYTTGGGAVRSQMRGDGLERGCGGARAGVRRVRPYAHNRDCPSVENDNTIRRTRARQTPH